MRLIGALVLSLALVLLVASTAKAADCGSPTDLHRSTRWLDGHRARAGRSRSRIDLRHRPAPRSLEGGEGARDRRRPPRRLVYEDYFSGKDWRLSMSLGEVKFDAGTKHDIRSISKSVTSSLVGIALDRGLLTDLDAPVFSFFPEYDDLRTPEKDHMTLRHNLTLSSGLAWNETSVVYTNPSNTYWQMGIAPRADHFVLAQPLAAPPGTRRGEDTETRQYS